MSADHVGALALMIVAVLLALWGFYSLAKELRDRRRRQIQAARRRHPSARPTMSERERRYHGSDQWGR